ncbi:hypothetical protein E4T38_08595 [Aureobasidium subglaciale]|nr:hypothetical protein E4T38_08595 [Aureobasidium subglaciale]KAI5215137.1 hypothetical protein E4T40_08608 [Aureobasidium subglaciale]KAI5218289.1 hypothetical protein E4T41_08462 [Aureobasidium subglaciale]KAI5255998.1 hypothetical protein E4T46_08496 [Aureobasidium subglaciale]
MLLVHLHYPFPNSRFLILLENRYLVVLEYGLPVIFEDSFLIDFEHRQHEPDFGVIVCDT